MEFIIEVFCRKYEFGFQRISKTQSQYTFLWPWKPNTPGLSRKSLDEECGEKAYHDLLRDAPDFYFTKPTSNTDNIPGIHDVETFSCNDQRQTLLNEDLDEDLSNHIQFDKVRNLSYLPFPTSLTLKRKRHMYYMPIDCEKLTLDGLIGTGALINAIPEEDLNKIKLLANEAIEDTDQSPNFQIMMVNGQLGVPIGTVVLEFEVADFMLRENFIIMKNLSNPFNGLCLLRRNNAIFDVTQIILTFPYLSMQLKPDTQVALCQATPLLAKKTYTSQQGETLATASRMPHLFDHNEIWIVTTSPQFDHHYSIFTILSFSTVNSNAVRYQIFNFSELS